MATTPTAIISRALIVGGHDGRAEIELELTYANGGTTTISLDEEACTASLDRAGVSSIEELVGQPWSIVLPAFESTLENHARSRHS
jgi:hypothetical protein